jgi:magnesium-protoporphyrin O-methyltransferase
MTGLRLLDAGCGTGALATLAAARGADVLAVDLSAKLVECARDRAAASARPPAAIPGRRHAGPGMASSTTSSPWTA